MEFLTVNDLKPFVADIDEAKALLMIEDATALAMLAAPCLSNGATLSEAQTGAIRALLRGAILRWNETGTGAIQSETVGPFSYTLDNRQTRRGMFWPSEITQLQDVCRGTGSGGAFSVDTTPLGYGLVHLDTCSVNFGGGCSCGIILTAGAGYYP